MGAKLEEGMYNDRASFAADFTLMVNNCKQYNVAGSYAHNEANALDAFFQKREHFDYRYRLKSKPLTISVEWVRIIKTLEAVDKASHAPSDDRAMPPPPILPAPPAPLEAPAASARPTIKLKNNTSTPKVPETSKPSSKPSSKPKARKPPVIDVPPPPYIDDGSHDLLQEVIAMEMEQDEKRRSTSERVSEKRKRSIHDDDEEILALAPAITSKRKLPPSVSAPSRLTSASANGISPKPSPGPSTPKDSSRAEPATPQPAKTKLSTKGKEKEVPGIPVVSAPTPPSKPRKSPTASATPMPLNEKKCRDVLKALLKMPEAVIFSRPVDAILDGCPTYVYIFKSMIYCSGTVQLL